MPVFDQIIVSGGYRVIAADPPWFFRTRTEKHSSRDPRFHYKGGVMPVSEIASLPVGDIASKDAHLFLWATGPCLKHAFFVMDKWGFNYSGFAFVWIKLKRSFDEKQLRFIQTAESDLHVGLGFTTRKNAEVCLLGRRGAPKRNAKNIREIILAPVREHSRKPDESYNRIMRYSDGPYLDLFGRQAREGWTVWGDETDKFKPMEQEHGPTIRHDASRGSLPGVAGV